MAFTQQMVVDKAMALGNVDATLNGVVDVTAELMMSKASAYIGYDCSTVDALLLTIAEMTLTQFSRYQSIPNASPDNASAIKISRGDYTVEYSADIQKFNAEKNILTSYEWILKKYKKLVTL